VSPGLAVIGRGDNPDGNGKFNEAMYPDAGIFLFDIAVTIELASV
jgi:hypothetical protein